MSKFTKWFVILGVFVVIVAGVFLVNMKPSQSQDLASLKVLPEVGDRMPPIQLQAVPSGAQVSSDKLNGKPIFINFWASWCPYCQLETPDIVKAYQQYGSKVEFMSVDLMTQDKLPDVTAFLKKYGIPYSVLLDSTGSVTQAYKVVGIPTSLFVNRSGIIDARYEGPMSAATLDAELQRISN